MRYLNSKTITGIAAIAIFATVAFNAYAQTDYNCVSQCVAQGYLYGLCVQQCSFR